MQAAGESRDRLVRHSVVPSAVLGTLFFVVAEVMFFTGMMSAFTITRANQLPGMWPPPGQPHLPAASTALNTVVLLASGVVLLFSHFAFRRRHGGVVWLLGGAWALGAAFLVLQGREWFSLLEQGLTMTSSTMGAFFFLIVGGHALHVVVALGALGVAWLQAARGRLAHGLFVGAQTFWYFVVVMWPVIYARVYF